MKVVAFWNVSEQEQELIASSWPKEHEVVIVRRPSDVAAARGIEDATVVVGGVSPELLSRAPNIKLVHTLGHGIDGLLKHRALLKERAITVARGNPASVNTAEFVIMSMIVLARRAFLMHEALAFHGDWSADRKAARMAGALGGELFGATLGLIGFGSIGIEILRRARAFDMKTGVLVRHPERIDAAAVGVDFTERADRIDSFLPRCDFVVLTLPLTNESRGLFNADRFRAMSPGSYLINISRGPVVEEGALFDALREGRLAGAASDVWTCEESGNTGAYPSAFPLHQFNVLMTPHYAGATRESRIRSISVVGDNLRRLAAGSKLLNVADLDLGY